VYVFIMSNTKKREKEEFTHITHTREERKKCVSSFSVLQFTDLLDQIGFFIIELFVIRTICMERRKKINKFFLDYEVVYQKLLLVLLDWPQIS